MRKLAILFPIVLFAAFFQIAGAQVVGVGANEQPLTAKEKAEAGTKLAVEKALKYAQARNYESFGRMSLYAGREPNRTMKVKVNMQDSYERLDLENTVNYIHHILEKTVIWNATNFRIVNAVNERYFYWDIEFTDEKMKTKVFTILLGELKGEFLFARFEKK
ncbi:MAG: hypothetical protein KAY96_05805 [Bacteroidia bacterium]|jgi:hypothetical protein|nr:hypothetical protein [Bacteroidota bacterium]MBP6639917.1 hypothetical protein [Bacteroidia bacterium]MBP8074252.1 hypothetical protein [Bacteroidia bacterium]